MLEGASVLQQQAVASPVEKPSESSDDNHTTKTVLQTETSPPVTTVSPPQKEKDIVDEVKPLQEEKRAKEEPVQVPTEPSKEDEDYDEPEEADKTQNDTDSDGSEFLKVLENCRDLICIQEAHAKLPRSSDMFNFPHFMIIGFQKAATTSLKQYVTFFLKCQEEDVYHVATL